MNILIVDDSPIFRTTYRADPWYLTSRGHRVTVVCPRPFVMKKSLMKDKDMKLIYTIPWKHPIKQGRDLVNKLVQITQAAMNIRNLLRKEKYDVIRAVGFLSAYSSLIARWRSNVPVVSNLTDFYSELYRQYMLPGAPVVVRLLRRMETKIVSESDVLFVDSSTMRHYWSYWGLDVKRCVVLPNGFDGDIFRREVSPTRIRIKYGINDSTKVVLYAGDISRMDGLDILIEAIPHISKEINAKYLILGSGPETYLNKLKAMVREKDLEKQVTFTGWIPYASVPEYLAAADVCVAPFRITLTSNSTECLKVVEYVAMAKPVVATRAKGLKELFGNVLNYVPPNDPQVLAETIVRTLKHGPLDIETIKRMKEISRRFTWQNVWKNEEKIMWALINREVDDFRVFDIINV